MNAHKYYPASIRLSERITRTLKKIMCMSSTPPAQTWRQMEPGWSKITLLTIFFMKKLIVEILLVVCLDQSECVSEHGHL